MKVLVDTSIWSLTLRRKEPSTEPQVQIGQKLTDLIVSSLVVMIGPVRQELLSGISNEEMFLKLRNKLGQFVDLPITTEDYETVAEFYNTCRKNGIQGSHIDFLICSIAYNNNLLIFSTDQDFVQFAKYVPVRLMSHV
jgi:predicted nucleic acid-binding protein